MTDLERVRDVLEDHRRAWSPTQPTRYDECIAIIDAHLKVDAADHQKMREDQNELAKLREENERYRAAQDGRFEDIIATLRTAEVQRDTLLAALREYLDAPSSKGMIRLLAAIAEVEGENTVKIDYDPTGQRTEDFIRRSRAINTFDLGPFDEDEV